MIAKREIMNDQASDPSLASLICGSFLNRCFIFASFSVEGKMHRSKLGGKQMVNNKLVAINGEQYLQAHKSKKSRLYICFDCSFRMFV